VLEARHVSLTHQLVDILMKPLGKTQVEFVYDKLSMYDINARA